MVKLFYYFLSKKKKKKKKKENAIFSVRINVSSYCLSQFANARNAGKGLKMGVINHKRGPKFKTEDEKKKKRIMVRLDEFTYIKLRERVEIEGVSISDYVRVAIEDALDRDADRERYGYDEY